MMRSAQQAKREMGLVDLVGCLIDLSNVRENGGLWARLFFVQLLGNLWQTGLLWLLLKGLCSLTVVRDFGLLAHAQAGDDPHRMLLHQQEGELEEGEQSNAKNNKKALSTRELHLAQTFVRHATAVYGKETMAKDAEISHNEDDTELEAIMKHVKAKLPSDVWVNRGEVHGCLRHTVIVDHSAKQVILSICGLRSMTGLFMALAAFSREFHGGNAHAAAADAAEAIWNVTGPTIEAKIKQMPSDYGLVITGHSLGGVVASLLNIHLYALRNAKQLSPSLDERLIQCYAFASAPSFTPASAAPEATQNTIVFVHNKDSIPTLSMHSCRLTLNNLLDVRTGASQRTSTKDLSPLEGAPILEFPARVVVWMEQLAPNSYRIHEQCPHKTADRAFQISGTMFSDHPPSSYSGALGLLLRDKQWRQLQPQ